VAPSLILGLVGSVVLRSGDNGELGASLHADRAPGQLDRNWVRRPGGTAGPQAAAGVVVTSPIPRAGASCPSFSMVAVPLRSLRANSDDHQAEVP
jgi:hypothetical protein